MRAGFLANPLRPAPSGGCGCGPSPFDGAAVWRFWREAERRSAFGRELRSNGLFLIKWLALAYVLEALLVAYVPSSRIAGLVGGDGVAQVAIAAVFGMPPISTAMWRRPCSPD